MEEELFQYIKKEVNSIIESVIKYPISNELRSTVGINEEYRLNTILHGAKWAESIVKNTCFDIEFLRVSDKGVETEHYKELCETIANISLKFMKLVLDDYLTDNPSVMRMPNSITLLFDLRRSIYATYKLEEMYLNDQNKNEISEIKKKILKLVRLHELDF